MSRHALIASVSAAFFLASAPGGGLATYNERTSGPAGQVTGIVHLEGKSPSLPENPVYKHVGECGSEMPDERLVLGDGGTLANTLVYFVDVTTGRPLDTSKQLLLDNRHCMFVPHVLSASRGQTLSVRNSDPFLHDAHAWLGSRTLFNIGLPKGKTVNKVLDDPGLIQINCNVRHTWMRAYVFVAENPYHTVSNREGRFMIDGLPPGTYTLRFWHELLGSIDRSVTIKADSTATVNVAFQPVAPSQERD